MKEILLGKRKLKNDENITLEDKFNAIIQRKLQPNLIDQGVNINMMLLTMMKKLNYGELKPTRMALTLVNWSIIYPYGVLEDVLIRVDCLFFPIDFVILDMPEDFETPLVLGGSLLEIGRALIDVELRDLVLRFNKENLVLNEFEPIQHHKQNP
ncbi:uncharacterized protein LOC127103710 [Lathyrus oleraceus]|uniref:uncharacterized protein LOC127103710 n=1 Tax=Pisum sativum TaxID=3888 RepID=UPI0021CE0921|nr:uncharacterized protein LOC127103710 [Pisum sativum]